MENNEFLWDILESNLAIRRYFIEVDGKVAEKPAFLVTFDHKSLRGYKLYMNRLADLGQYKSMREIQQKLQEIVNTNKMGKIRVIDTSGKSIKEIVRNYNSIQ